MTAKKTGGLRRFALYLIRWQMSTPILAGVLWLLADWPALAATVVANLVGGVVFFWVDRAIFERGRKE